VGRSSSVLEPGTWEFALVYPSLPSPSLASSFLWEAVSLALALSPAEKEQVSGKFSWKVGLSGPCSLPLSLF
jgi:hypothetical protein